MIITLSLSSLSKGLGTETKGMTSSLVIVSCNSSQSNCPIFFDNDKK